MANQFDIIIKNAKLRGQDETFFGIGIAGGKIVALEQNLTSISTS